MKIWASLPILADEWFEDLGDDSMVLREKKDLCLGVEQIVSKIWAVGGSKICRKKKKKEKERNTKDKNETDRRTHKQNERKKKNKP